MTQPSRWLVLTVHVPPDAPDSALVAEALLSAGGAAVLEEPAGLTTWLPAGEGDSDAAAEEVVRAMALSPPIGPHPVSWRWSGAEDWEREWKRGLQPRRISSRLVVKPSWTDWTPEPDQEVIEIDPEMAFGTGEHATTRACLRLLDRYVRRGDRVLDVGSGSGILSIAAARLGAASVVAIEVDSDANMNARDNMSRNGVGDRVRLIEALADDDLLRDLEAFDLIVANILSGVILQLAAGLHDALAPGGTLIVSGILFEERATVLAGMTAAGFGVVDEDVEAEWWSAALRRQT